MRKSMQDIVSRLKLLHPDVQIKLVARPKEATDSDREVQTAV